MLGNQINLYRWQGKEGANRRRSSYSHWRLNNSKLAKSSSYVKLKFFDCSFYFGSLLRVCISHLANCGSLNRSIIVGDALNTFDDLMIKHKYWACVFDVRYRFGWCINCSCVLADCGPEHGWELLVCCQNILAAI